MTAEQFIHEFYTLSAEDKRRVMMAIGPAFCREIMGHPDIMEEMRRWCQQPVELLEMKDLWQRMRGQQPWRKP